MVVRDDVRLSKFRGITNPILSDNLSILKPLENIVRVIALVPYHRSNVYEHNTRLIVIIVGRGVRDLG